MKKFILSLTLMAIATMSFSQDQYTKGMSKALGFWTDGKPVEAVALFERIGQADQEQWHPYYYAANVLITQSFSNPDEVSRMASLEKAKTYIAEGHKRSPANSELLTLEGLLYTGYVAMDPATYGMKYSQMIMELHGKAISINPDNPRALANHIEYEMGSARFFGQDLAPLCAKLQETLAKFDNQKSDNPFDPSYGKERVQEVISTCGK